MGNFTPTKKNFFSGLKPFLASLFAVLVLCLTGFSASAQIPPNDELCGAINLVPNPACTFQTFTNVDALGSANTPLPTCANYTDGDVWFKFTVPAGATSVTIDSKGMGMTDGGMSVYSFTGTNCASYVLTQVACDDGSSTSGGGNMPKITVNPVSTGQVYYIRFWGFGGETGTFGLCVTANIPPSNDECLNATALTVNPDYLCGVTTAGTTNNAGQSTNTPVPTCGTANGYNDDVWFSFTSTTSAHRIVLSNILPSGTVMTIQVYSGTCGALVPVSCIVGNTLNLTGLTPNQPYLVRVFTNVATAGTTASFNICVGTAPPPPPNDECVTAVNVPVNPDLNCGIVVAGTTESATQSSGAPTPTCGTAAGINDDVWFKFTATGPTHWITLSAITPANTMNFQVFSGTCGSFTQIACVTGTNIQVLTGLTASQVYYVRVFTNVATAGTVSAFNICVGTPPLPPANDEPAGAVSLPVNANMACTLTGSGTTAGATQTITAPAPTCGTVNGWNDDVWFTFIATSTTHSVSFPSVTPAGTVMNAVVYSGTPGSLTQIGCATNTILGINNLIVGNTYYVRVFTNVTTPTVFANFTICIGTPPPIPPCSGNLPAGNTCAIAPSVCNFDGYCGNTSAAYTVNTWPELTSAFCGSIENNSFVTFVASATTASFNVWVTTSASNLGIQMMFYSGGCGSGPVTSYGCAAYNPIPPTPVGGLPTVVTANGLTIGNTYYLMFDGFAGDVCDYVITPINGVNVLTVTPTAATICAGASVTLTASGGNGTYSWSPATGLNTTTGATVIATPAVNTTYTVTSLGSSGCPVTKTVTITVNANASLTLTSAAATANQTICVGTPLTNITYAVGSGATGAAVTGLPAGVTGTYAGGVFTISGSPTASGTFNYTVTTTGGCSGAASQTGTITVTLAGTLTLTSAAGTNVQSVCINSPITNIVYQASAGATGVTATGFPAGVTGTFAGGVYTISGTPSVAGVFPYSVSTAGCGAAQTGTITVTNVTITLTSAAATANQTVCINNPITNIVYTSANGATGVTVTGLPSGVTGTYSGGTNGTFTISGTPTSTGVFSYIVTASGCGTATISGTITVSTASTVTLTSAAGTNSQTVCINAPITNITYSIGGGGTGATVSGLPAGVTGAFATGVFTISGTSSVSGTFTYIVTPTGGCGTATATGTITVNPASAFTLTSGSATQTVCINTAIANIVYTGALGITGATVTGLPAGVTGVYSGGTNGTFTISGTPTAAGTFNYTVTSSGGCGAVVRTGTITVNALSALTLTSASGTNAQTVCINTAITNITYAVSGVATGATVTGLPAGVTGTYSAGAVTISGTATASGTFTYNITTTGGCGTATAAGTIIVSPATTITLTSAAATANQTVCINTAITNIVYTTANGATNVTVTGLPAGVTGTFAAGVFTISGTPAAAGAFSYTVSTAGGCGTAIASGTITVSSLSTITLTSAAGTNAQTLCISTALATITYATASGATNATVTGLPAGVTGTYAAGVFTISGTPTTAGTFNYTVSTSGGCGVATATGTIIVRALSSITRTSAAATAAQIVCQNGNITAITYAIGGSASGAAVTGLPAGVSGTYAAGVFTISGASTVSGTFNYTVTPAGGCGTATATGTITVNPALIANAGNPVTIVSGTSTQLNGSASTAGAAYLWTASGPLALVAPSTATQLNPFVAPVQTTTYMLTVTDPLGICPAAGPSSVVVTVVTSCINVRNAFTPNGDGINDKWFVYDQSFCLANDGVSVNVFNRYGSKVYESQNYKNTWDGNYKGKPVPDGTYYAIINFKLANGNTQVVKTDVTVLR